MRKRLWAGLVLAGLTLTVSLATYRGLAAREVVVPAMPQLGQPEETALVPVSRIETVPSSTRVPTMMVSSRKIRLNYSVSDVGPSGVSAIELWATRDGRTWQRYSNEPPPAGPLVVHVAEEGRYGFSIVVKSGVGLVSHAPATGSDPQLWVEVDETKPAISLYEPKVGKGVDAGALTIGWSATDANLTPRPVTISMAASKDGPWAPIATNIENCGKYVWQMPKDLPYQFHVKVEAADRAGNVGEVCTLEPIKVDLSRPKGTILGVDVEKKPAAPLTEVECGWYPGCEHATDLR